jgi:hypothetical protein
MLALANVENTPAAVEQVQPGSSEFGSLHWYSVAGSCVQACRRFFPSSSCVRHTLSAERPERPRPGRHRYLCGETRTPIRALAAGAAILTFYNGVGVWNRNGICDEVCVRYRRFRRGAGLHRIIWVEDVALTRRRRELRRDSARVQLLRHPHERRVERSTAHLAT